MLHLPTRSLQTVVAALSALAASACAADIPGECLEAADKLAECDPALAEGFADHCASDPSLAPVVMETPCDSIDKGDIKADIIGKDQGEGCWFNWECKGDDLVCRPRSGDVCLSPFGCSTCETHATAGNQCNGRNDCQVGLDCVAGELADGTDIESCECPGDGTSPHPACVPEDAFKNAEGEIIVPGEVQEFERNGAEINDIQDRAAARSGGPIKRGFHNKSHACVSGSFVVDPDIPDELRVGPLFGAPGAPKKAWVRFSNGSPFMQSDLIGDFRGLAIKVVGVPGEKMMPEAIDAVTQDFLMLNNPFMAAPGARSFMEFTRAATDPETEKCLFGVCISTSLFSYLADPDHEDTRGFILDRVFLRLVSSMRNQRFWSGSTFKFGDTTMRYSVKPCDDFSALPGITNDYLRRDIVDKLAESSLCYDMYLQLETDGFDSRTGGKATPIENAADEWTETEAPPIRAARLLINQRDMNSCEAQRAEDFCNDLRFTPWHSSPDYRPLGSINRVRLAVYRASQGHRSASNTEPDGTETFACTEN